MQIFQNILYKYANISKYFILQMKNYDKLGIIIFWLFIKITTIIITLSLSAFRIKPIINRSGHFNAS